MIPLPPQPLLVAANWGAAGAAALGALLGAAAIAAFLYRRALQRADPLPLRLVLSISAIGLAIAWVSPVLFSSDVYAYAAYGEMARIGLNPYGAIPANTVDAVIRAAQSQWVSAFPICVYGPAFLALARSLVTIFAPLGLLAQLDAFRVCASLAFLLCVPLAYAVFPGDCMARLRATATIALNPAAIWCACEGHNDTIALAVLLVGFLLVRRRWNAIGGAIAALSTLVKAPGAAAAVALALVDRHARVGVVAGIVIAATLSIPLITGVATHLAPRGLYAPQASLQAILAPVSPVLAAASAVAVSLPLAARGIALCLKHASEGWISLGLAAWVLVPNPYPWYGLWLVALAALAPRTPAATVAILLSLTTLLRYIPDAIAVPAPPLAAAIGVFAALPLLRLLPVRAWYNERSHDR